jgi:hypothetical protein
MRAEHTRARATGHTHARTRTHTHAHLHICTSRGARALAKSRSAATRAPRNMYRRRQCDGNTPPPHARLCPSPSLTPPVLSTVPVSTQTCPPWLKPAGPPAAARGVARLETAVGLDPGRGRARPNRRRQQPGSSPAAAARGGRGGAAGGAAAAAVGAADASLPWQTVARTRQVRGPAQRACALRALGPCPRAARGRPQPSLPPHAPPAAPPSAAM